MVLETDGIKPLMTDENLAALQSEMRSIQNELNNYIATKHVEVKVVQDNSSLIGRLNRLCDKAHHLDFRVSNEITPTLERMSLDIKTSKTDLDSTKVACNTMKTLLNVDLEHDRMLAYMNNNQYTQAAKYLHNASELMSVSSENPLQFLKVYKPLQASINADALVLYSKLIDSWNDSVQWNIREIGPDAKICVLAVTSSKEEIGQLMEALTACDRKQPTKTFANNLYDHILIMCIKYKCRVTILQDKTMIEIASQLDSTPHFNEVVANLTEVFLFLKETINFELNDDDDECFSYLRVIGDKLEKEFIDSLINDCLYNVIPIEHSAVPIWEELYHEVVNIQSFLKEIGFLSSTNKDLEDFCSSFEEKQREKLISNMLTKIDSLTSDKFQNMILVKADSIATDIEPKGVRFNGEISNKELQKHLVPDVLEFPACKISTSTTEFLKIVREILTVATNDPTDTSLFGPARDIITKYINALKDHNKLFFSIPQQSALFYNNCWYIAHHLIVISEEFRDTLLYQKHRINYSLVDISCLITEGAVALDQQITKQIECLITTLKKSGLSNINDWESFPEEAEKRIKQCLHQLNFLKTLWYEVLSNPIYLQVMGYMCNAFLNEIIIFILAARDIRSVISACLVDVLTLIKQQLPGLFPEPVLIFRHVRSWGKLRELIIILAANLLQINERWSEGKGPLANEFNASQVRHLIKALFQNSNRRTALLSKIK